MAARHNVFTSAPLLMVGLVARSVEANALEEQPWWGELPEFAWYIIFACGGILILFALCMCYCCLCSPVHEPDEADLEMAKKYMTNQERTQSEFLSQTVSKPAKGLSSAFGKKEKFIGRDVSDQMLTTLNNDVAPNQKPAKYPYKGSFGTNSTFSGADSSVSALSTPSRPPKKKNPAPTPGGYTLSPDLSKAEAEADVPAWKPKNVARHGKGLSYGRLDPEAQERVKSVRLMAAEGGMVPFQVSKPSAKALRMMGATETEVTQAYAAPVEERMKRIAKKAGGGVYGTNFGTAALGNQIIDGFNERKRKLNIRADARKAKKDLEQTKKKVTDMKAQETLKREKKKKKLKPKAGQSMLAAFIEQEDSNDEFSFDVNSDLNDDEF